MAKAKATADEAEEVENPEDEKEPLEAEAEGPVLEDPEVAAEGKAEEAKEMSKGSGDAKSLFKKLAKALELKESDILSSNDQSLTAVFSNGGKYQISKNAKTIRHFSGPKPPEDSGLKVIDARFRSNIGGAALLNRDPKE